LLLKHSNQFVGDLGIAGPQFGQPLNDFPYLLDRKISQASLRVRFFKLIDAVFALSYIKASTVDSAARVFFRSANAAARRARSKHLPVLPVFRASFTVSAVAGPAPFLALIHAALTVVRCSCQRRKSLAGYAHRLGEARNRGGPSPRAWSASSVSVDMPRARAACSRLSVAKSSLIVSAANLIFCLSVSVDSNRLRQINYATSL
jgi:hypothetical protein